MTAVQEAEEYDSPWTTAREPANPPGLEVGESQRKMWPQTYSWPLEALEAAAQGNRFPGEGTDSPM